MSENRFRSKKLIRVLIVIAAFVVLIQVIPYGHGHINPPVTVQPVWDSPQTRETFMRTCGNCHSNETTWPWYSHVAPISWLVTWDVTRGRDHLNVSEWDRPRNDGDEAAEMVRKGEMPPRYYLSSHPEARMDEAEKAGFIRGLVATFGDEEAEGGGGRKSPAGGDDGDDDD